METIELIYPAKRLVEGCAHIGVVGSGDLEVLLQPSPDQQAHVRICTSVEGYRQVWEALLVRFFARYDGAASILINDFGATPGMVTLRLQQAVEECR